MSKIPAKTFVAVLLALFSFTLLTSPSAADTAVGMPSGAEIRDATTAGGDCKPIADLRAADAETPTGSEAERLNNLPLNRWGGSTSNLHSRLGAKPHDDIRQKLSRDLMQSMMMSFGDAIWGITGGLVTFATEYSVLDKAGCTADAAAATLGNALFQGFAPILAGVGVFLLIWRARSGQGGQPGKQIARTVITIAVFGFLLQGAMTTAKTNTISPVSPGYLAITIDGIVTAVAASPTSVMNENMPTAAAFGVSGDSNSDSMACSNYVRELRSRYMDGEGVVDNAQTRIPVAVSAMWEQSGLMSFIKVQYGSKNPYGELSYCHYLERAAGIPPDEQREIMTASGALGGGVDELYAGGNNSTEDQAGVFWAACTHNGSWQLRSGWDVVTGSDGGDGDSPDADSCAAVYSDWGAGESSSGFEWSDSASNIEKRTESTPEVRDFMLNWHGDAVSNGLAVSFVYVASSIVILLVFGLIAVGVIIAKSVGVVMIVLVFLMLTVALIPSAGEQSKIGKFFKFWLGMTFYSAGLMFIMSLVALVTSFVNQVGLESFGPGSLMSILWMGFAPVTAVVLLHVVFKHAVGIPSPFKPGSALAYGAMAGTAGAALGVGLDRSITRGRGMATGYARGMAHGRGGRSGGRRSKGADQRMPVGGRRDTAPAADPLPKPAASTSPPTGDGGAGGDSEATSEARPERGKAGRADRKGARKVARKSNREERKRRRKESYDRWKGTFSRRRMLTRAGIGAGALVWGGIGGAAAVLASPAVPIVGAALGARALGRARARHKTRVATGEHAADREAARSRTNERVQQYHAQRRAERRAEQEAAENGSTVDPGAGAGGPSGGGAGGGGGGGAGGPSGSRQRSGRPDGGSSSGADRGSGDGGSDGGSRGGPGDGAGGPGRRHREMPTRKG